MSFVDHVERGGRRRRSARPAGKRASVTTLGFISTMAVVALGLVWQGVHYTGAKLELDKARKEERRLLCDIDALRIKLQGAASVTELEPVARERLGLVDPPAGDFHLVTFPDAGPAPNLIDQVLPNAFAGSSRR